MRNILCCCLLVLYFNQARAQNLIDFSYDWLDTNQFHTIHGTIIGDWFSSPVTMHQLGTFPNGEPNQEPRNSLGIGLVSFVYEPRLNIYNYYDYISVSLSAPVTVSFSAVVGETNGIGNVHVPLMLEGNFFGHATSASYDERGFTVGIGARYTLAPVIQIDDPGQYGRRHWIAPIARLTYKWENYGGWQMVNLSVGYSKAYKYKIYDGGNPAELATQTSLSSFGFLLTVGREIEW